MKSKKGLSDVVTTVILIALALVAITIVWVLVQRVISSNSGNIELQQKCLETELEVSGIESEDGKSVTVYVKRIRGSPEISGLTVYAENSTGGQDSKEITEKLKVGQMVSKTMSINNPTGVSAVISFSDEGGNLVPCSPIEGSIKKA